VAEDLPLAAGGCQRDVDLKRCSRVVVLAIGPTTVYLILAVVFLVVLGGGTWLVFYMDRRRSLREPGGRRGPS
jgi:hypothetical protein